MFRKDKFIYGFLVGMILPALAWVYENILSKESGISNSRKIIFLISIAMNLILVRIAYKNDFDKTGSGIMFTTFLAAIMLFYLKIQL